METRRPIPSNLITWDYGVKTQWPNVDDQAIRFLSELPWIHGLYRPHSVDFSTPNFIYRASSLKRTGGPPCLTAHLHGERHGSSITRKIGSSHPLDLQNRVHVRGVAATMYDGTQDSAPDAAISSSCATRRFHRRLAPRSIGGERGVLFGFLFQAGIGGRHSGSPSSSLRPTRLSRT